MTRDHAPAIRLQRILSSAGVASRRASERLMLEGRVTVNGATVREPGSKADPDVDDIRVDGRRVRAQTQHRYVLVNKPAGYVTTRSDPQKRPTVIDLLGPHAGYIYPVGRLDYDTEGLLLLTTDGDLAARLTHPRHEVEREYEAIVVGVPDEGSVAKIEKGLYIEGGRTAPAAVRVGRTVSGSPPTTKLSITLREGRNRQVRKMCAAIGHPVRSLRRVRMGSLSLGRLRTGEWRELTEGEVRRLRGEGRGR